MVERVLTQSRLEVIDGGEVGVLLGQVLGLLTLQLLLLEEELLGIKQVLGMHGLESRVAKHHLGEGVADLGRGLQFLIEVREELLLLVHRGVLTGHGDGLMGLGRVESDDCFIMFSQVVLGNATVLLGRRSLLGNRHCIILLNGTSLGLSHISVLDSLHIDIVPHRVFLILHLVLTLSLSLLLLLITVEEGVDVGSSDYLASVIVLLGWFLLLLFQVEFEQALVE